MFPSVAVLKITERTSRLGVVTCSQSQGCIIGSSSYKNGTEEEKQVFPRGDGFARMALVRVEEGRVVSL